MIKASRYSPLAVCLLSLAMPLADAAPILSVGSEVYHGDATAKVLAEQSRQLRNAAPQTVYPNIELDPVSADEQTAFAARNGGNSKILNVGFGRTLPAAYQQAFDYASLSWHSLADGGQAATFTITSPAAAALRVQFALNQLPLGTEFRFFSPDDPAKVRGPVGLEEMLRDKDAAGEALYWSPTIEGSTLAVEIYLPAEADTQALYFFLPQVSHLLATLTDDSLKNLAQVGSSTSCEIDVACKAGGVPQVLVNSVAKYILTRGNGSSGLCSGTLLNDSDPNSQIPYFMTANHCFADQVTASSLDLYWFFERAVCGGADPTTVSNTTGGGTLLATSRDTDFTLIRLNNAPPAGVGFSGWVATALPLNSTVVGIHHPAGDLKKISFGTFSGLFAREDIPDSTLFTIIPDNNGSFIGVNWTEGVTEGGSSGSGIWSDIGNGDFRFVGNLLGGGSACANQAATDVYGRFDRTFPQVQTFLAAGSSNVTNLQNISTNGQLDSTGMTAGFIVEAPGRFVILAEGNNGLDPVLELNGQFLDAAGAVQNLSQSNDNWNPDNQAELQQVIGRSPAAATASALVLNLGVGIYNAKIRGQNGATGSGVIAVNQAIASESPHIRNISTNGLLVDANGMTAGFQTTKAGRYVILAEGNNGLDPVLELSGQFLDANNAVQNLSLSNDNYDPANGAEIQSTIGRLPNNTTAGALVLDLGIGRFFAKISGRNGTTGSGIIAVTQTKQ